MVESKRAKFVSDSTKETLTRCDQMEESLRTGKEVPCVILENARDGIAVADLEGRIFECNPAYAALLGYTREDLLKKTIADHCCPK